MFHNLPTYLNVLAYQCLWIPEPPMTEKNVPDLGGKVLLVTGGDTRIGYHLCRILYARHGSVYLTSQNVERGEAAIKRIKAAHPASLGRIHGLYLDLGDLTSIKASVKALTDRESRLDVLWNNADVMTPSLLQKTAAIAPLYTVRVLWAGASSIVFFAPTGGVEMDEGTDGNGKDAKPVPQWSQLQNYAQSKAGNLFLAHGLAKEVEGSGIVSVCFNPGNCFTESGWHMSGSELLQRLILYTPEKGAYTELYCGLSPELTAWHNGKYFAPWGCMSRTRRDIDDALKIREYDGKNNIGKGDAGKPVAGQKEASKSDAASVTNKKDDAGKGKGAVKKKAPVANVQRDAADEFVEYCRRETAAYL
ncbi:NAD(P)-binding protein [Mytilinidion resinicola]|uniref:NAD(P)-binding protein n=1 Tax=Mytilinidion resinicola TaxID=574789 RepID=A0A6A6Y6A5_9PEZI|nr:NAD(P)-binding protein [Mytilinidion resinicola]KAF2804356.1 NAD(P)-binding protein [Mytilinidion resinicola]